MCGRNSDDVDSGSELYIVRFLGGAEGVHGSPVDVRNGDCAVLGWDRMDVELVVGGIGKEYKVLRGGWGRDGECRGVAVSAAGVPVDKGERDVVNPDAVAALRAVVILAVSPE